MRTPAVVVMSVSLLTACNFGGGSSSKTDSGATVTESGQELSKNPFKAVQQLGDMGQKMAEKAKELEKRKPVDPVKFDVLIPLLPEPSGWKASEADGATSAMGEFKVTTVSRRYEKEGGERVKIEIVDGGYVPFVYAGFTMMSQFSQETTEGHTKGVTIDGFPAVEEWKKKSKDAKITALVNDRFLVSVDGDNLDPAQVREWVGMVDLKKVAKLQ